MSNGPRTHFSYTARAYPIACGTKTASRNSNDIGEVNCARCRASDIGRIAAIQADPIRRARHDAYLAAPKTIVAPHNR